MENTLHTHCSACILLQGSPTTLLQRKTGPLYQILNQDNEMQTQIPIVCMSSLIHCSHCQGRVLTTKLFWDEHILSLQVKIFHFSKKTPKHPPEYQVKHCYFTQKFLKQTQQPNLPALYLQVTLTPPCVWSFVDPNASILVRHSK